MASTPPAKTGSVVVDANVLIGICAKEKDKFTKARDALAEYAKAGWAFYAPGVVVGEVLYVLCGKLQTGSLTAPEYEAAVKSFEAEMKAVLPPPGGDAALITKAEEMREGYGCGRSADSIYLALACELAQSDTVELLTFDRDLQKQAAKKAPSITVNLL
jgi:predicted nucleic acid-binding protein